MTNQELGKKGESVACRFLENSGYVIVSKNYKCTYGEIDIIAMDQEELVFVEVKTRCSKKYGEARESVNEYKSKHIKKAAAYYIYKHKLESKLVRFDVMELYLKEDHFLIKQIKNTLW